MSSVLDIVRAAIPNADAGLATAILWERTAFPVGAVTPRELYLAASRFRRAEDHGLVLCDFCDRTTPGAPGLCVRCSAVLSRAALNREADDGYSD